MSMIINFTKGIIWLPVVVPRAHLILLMVGLAIFCVWKPTLFKANDACLLFECLWYIRFGWQFGKGVKRIKESDIYRCRS